MPLNMLNGPQNPIAALKQATELFDLRRSTPQQASPAGGAVAVNFSARPIPVFVVGITEAANPFLQELKQPAGWRYLILDDDKQPAALADIDNNAESLFRSLMRGPVVQGVQKAAQLAEELYGKALENYEVRLLEAPSLYRMALWLHGSQDHFIAIDGEKVASDDGFAEHLTSLARARKGSGTHDGALVADAAYHNNRTVFNRLQYSSIRGKSKRIR